MRLARTATFTFLSMSLRTGFTRAEVATVTLLLGGAVSAVVAWTRLPIMERLLTGDRDRAYAVLSERLATRPAPEHAARSPEVRITEAADGTVGVTVGNWRCLGIRHGAPGERTPACFRLDLRADR